MSLLQAAGPAIYILYGCTPRPLPACHITPHYTSASRVGTESTGVRPSHQACPTPDFQRAAISFGPVQIVPAYNVVRNHPRPLSPMQSVFRLVEGVCCPPLTHHFHTPQHLFPFPTPIPTPQMLSHSPTNLAAITGRRSSQYC